MSLFSFIFNQYDWKVPDLRKILKKKQQKWPEKLLENTAGLKISTTTIIMVIRK